jgi:hypothetical protein
MKAENENKLKENLGYWSCPTSTNEMLKVYMDLPNMHDMGA